MSYWHSINLQMFTFYADYQKHCFIQYKSTLAFKPRSRMSKIITFILTLLSYQLYNALLLVYSSIKPDLMIKYGFSESFLGSLQLFSFFFRFIGTILFIIIPPQKLNLANFLSSFIQLIGLILLVSINFVDNNQQILAAFGMSIFGLVRCVVIIPFILLLTQLNKETDSALIAIWMAAGSMGNALGFFYAQILNSIFKAEWYFTVLSFSVLYFLLNGLLLLCVKQTDMNRFSNLDLKQRLALIQQSVAFHIRKHSHKIIMIEAMITENISFTTNVWSPVYLSNVGLKKFDLLIPIAFSVTLPAGPILINMGSNIFSTSRKSWINFFILLQTLGFASLLLLSDDSDHIPFYFITYTLLGVAQGAFMGCIAANELLNSIQGDAQHEFIILNVVKALREIQTAVLLQIFGYLMYLNNNFFVYLSISVGVSFLLLNILKDHLKNKEAQEEEYQSLQE